MATVPEHARERKALAREAARRREAVRVLLVAADTAAYAASVMANGATPAEARQAALDAAGELAAAADGLRRLTRLRGPARRALARQLAARGVTRREIAIRCGVSGVMRLGLPPHRRDAR